jgi:hypothetical protein
MCQHSYFETDYNTLVCRNCGLEIQTDLKSDVGYTDNVPLETGYSRSNRMKMLLRQLFQPQMYGCPNSEVSAHAIQHGPFTNGTTLLGWLAQLKVKHKQYQNTHFYFAISDKSYRIPPKPCHEKINGIMKEFQAMETLFQWRKHNYTSFFSYNWLLRKLLVKWTLCYYIPFVKQIKCKKRQAQYERMWDFFMTSNSAVTAMDASQTIQIPPALLPAHVLRNRQVERSILSLLTRNYLSRKGAVA